MFVWPLLLFAVWPLLWQPRRLPDLTPKKTLLLGHRGVRGPLPENPLENTLPAFKAALDAGLDGVETDVQRTRDGSLILFHDFALPDGRRVVSLTQAELKMAVPDLATLEELFLLARGFPGTLLNLELKTAGWRTGGLERAAAAAIRASGMDGRVLVSSFNPLSLVRLRLYAPELRAALLYSPDGPRWLRTNRAAHVFVHLLHPDALHPRFSLIDAELTVWARRRGLILNAWTVNDPEDVKRLARLDVNGLMADNPKLLKDALKEA